MIIAGAAMFVVGILFCLLCGHVCDGLTKRVRKPRRSRDKTKPVVVWLERVELTSLLADNYSHLVESFQNGEV